MSHSADADSVKSVFLSAVQFATSTHSFPPFIDDLKLSAQEQVEYMLVEDQHAPLFINDDHVKSELRTCLSKMFSLFEVQACSLLLQSDDSLEAAAKMALSSLSDIEWICKILPKMDLMKDFVVSWLCISEKILAILREENIDTFLWAFKLKLLEVLGKVLEAIGYGNVVLPTAARVCMLKLWLPYIRKWKLLLDLHDSSDQLCMYKIDSDLCHNIEAAIVSLVLALPSNDQAEIFSDWLTAEKVTYPDLSEAFELWCFRSKAAKRRCMAGENGVGAAPL
ncbi:BTB/POZ domain-containing protein At3g05675 [Nymphaea colorata]|uniref:At3g05675-like ankyrin-like domain-containing protein n=1 Tax=Nymphaea colorata TaxID=210225 RepID=A0A5K1AT00_9MAGN|nr:BTB/POZ domain-containing protein At3g05675 [Nymphaea colorata]XP_031478073.1 BTB/POZ domain-containing protein At3g05675 [Nymphaea colorata]